MENIPNLIYELIEQEPFETLSATNQTLVLQYLTQSEYETMHKTAQALKHNTADFTPINAVQKDKLMQQFHMRKQPLRPLWNKPIQVWKAAAIFLLLGGGWFVHWQTYQRKHIEYVTQLDTVYLEKKVPVKIYDTVYCKEEKNASYASHQKRNIPSEKSTVGQPTTNRKEDYIEPARRGTSAKDDSLIQSFKFVTL